MSGIAKINVALSALPIPVKDEKKLDHWVNRLVTPIIRALLQATNKLSGSVVATSANTTILDGGERLVLVDASSGPRTVILSAPTALFRDVVIQKVDASANAVTIAAPAGKTVNGVASLALAAQWDKKMVLADDAAFYA